MMNSRLWIALHALVALAPPLAALARAPDARLFGSEARPEPPTPALEAWRSEKLQPVFQTWFETGMGLRGAMVRTDNTLQTRLLGATSPSSTVVRGEDGTLFLKDDIWFMGRRAQDLPSTFEVIERLAEGLGSVQRKLASKGKTFIVLVAPSKTAAYPEAVPEEWRRSDGSRTDVTAHDYIRSSFERHGVSFADGHALVEGTAGAERELLFMRSGRHWTRLGACRVLRDALADGPVTPTCAYELAESVWAGSHEWNGAVDFDLDRLLNVWRLGSNTVIVPTLTEAAPRPDPHDGSEPSKGPRTLFVGTSFMWMLTDVLRPLVSAPIALYYNTTVYDVSTTLQPIEPVDESSPRWASYVLERDLYVVEVLETYAHGAQLLKFVQTLDARLDRYYAEATPEAAWSDETGESLNAGP